MKPQPRERLRKRVGRERATRSSGNAVLCVPSDAGTASLTLVVAGLRENQQAVKTRTRYSLHGKEKARRLHLSRRF